MSYQMYVESGVSDTQIANAMSNDPDFAAHVLRQIVDYCDPAEIAIDADFTGEERAKLWAFVEALTAEPDQ